MIRSLKMCDASEVMRLKSKCNELVTYVRYFKKRERETGLGFFSSLIDSLCHLEANGHVFKLRKRSQNHQYLYIPVSEFFEAFSGRMPEYRKKDVIEALKMFGITDTSDNGHGANYGKKRVLKIDEERFHRLTKGGINK
jgi:hypothetical protein